MNPAHFRIGDLIQDFECEPYYFPIEQIKLNEQGNLAVYYRNGSCMWVDPDPVPITEDWLVKMGFEKGEYSWYGKKYETEPRPELPHLEEEEMKLDYNLNSKRCGLYDAIEETDMVNILSHPVMTKELVLYVHQLQQLWFALTNQNLEIK